MYSSGVGQFGRGFCAYKSKDLENWSEPFVVFDASGFWAKDDYWAPKCIVTMENTICSGRSELGEGKERVKFSFRTARQARSRCGAMQLPLRDGLLWTQRCT